MHARLSPVGTLAAAGALAVAGAVAGALAVSAGGVPASAAGSPAPPCAARGLVVWLDTQGSGAAGSIYYRLEFTNLSGHACTLRGYPRIAAVSLSGRQLGSVSARLGSPTPLVRLANRDTSSAVLQVVEVGNFSSSACRPVTAAGLRVFPPHQSSARVVPFPFGACSRAGPQYLFAQAVRPRA
jgi:Domain of unknown function (DUF4232)